MTTQGNMAPPEITSPIITLPGENDLRKITDAEFRRINFSRRTKTAV